MSVSFKPSPDNQTLVLTSSGIAYIKQQELKIYNGPGNDVYKGSLIDQLYLLHGVDQGTYEKSGWRQANYVKPREKSSPSSSSSSTEHSPFEVLMTILIIGVGLFCVWLYQAFLHPFYNYLFN